MPSSRNKTVNTTQEQAFGKKDNLGVSSESARRDHTHGTPVNPVDAHESESDPHPQYIRDQDIVTTIGTPGVDNKVPSEKATRTGLETKAPKAHDHTTADATGPATNDEHDGFIEISTSAVPSTPASGKMRLFAEDAGGVARLRAVHSTASNLAFFRDSVTRVRNSSGVTISKGEVVYVTGSTGVFPTVAKAKADSDATMPAIGMMISDTVNNSFGTVQITGIVGGLDTSMYTEGDSLHVSTSTAGGLQVAEPTHPNLLQHIGIVIKSNAGAGQIQAFVTPMHEGNSFGSNESVYKLGPNGELEVTTGKISKYNNVVTDDYGVPVVVDGVHLAGQVADITTTNFTNAGTAGNYEVTYYLQSTTGDATAGVLTLSISWTDDANALTITTTKTLATAGTTFGSFPVRLASGNITYAISHTGIFGVAAYRLDLTCKRTN